MSKTSECETCLGVNAECVDCGGSPMADDVEIWKHAGEGKCAGCERVVRNRWSKGRGAACLPCLWTAWGKHAQGETP
jgi:hypothetical protein